MDRIAKLFAEYLEVTAGDRPAAAGLVVARCLSEAEPAPPAADGMLSVKQAAADLGVCEWTVYNLARCGRLPASRIGKGRGTLRFNPADLEAYKRESAGNPLPKRAG